MQTSVDAPHVHVAVSGDRRNFCHVDGALVLDLHDLDAVEADAMVESISLPPLPGQRVNTSRLRIVEKPPGATGASGW